MYGIEISLPLRKKLVEKFVKLARTLNAGGARVVWSESTIATQLVWPEDCPLSEPELREKIQAITDDLKDLEQRTEELRERARVFYETLPEYPPLEDEADLPQCIYYALTDGLSAFVDEEERECPPVRYLERKLADTPESLRADWLKKHLRNRASFLLDSEYREAVSEAMGLLCGEPAASTSG